MNSQTQQMLDKALKGPEFEKRVRRRNAKDTASKVGISVGGVGVILSVLLIMFFLLYVVLPLFAPATVNKSVEYAIPGSDSETTLYYGMDEYQETALRFTQSGRLFGFDVVQGKLISEDVLPLQGQTITSFSVISEMDNLLAFGLSSGGVLVAKYEYSVSYPNNVRTITPKVLFPFGEEAVELGTAEIEKLAVRKMDSDLVFAYAEKGSHEIKIKQFSTIESMLSDTISLEEGYSGSFVSEQASDWLLLDGSMRNLYVIDKTGQTSYYDIRDIESPQKVEQVQMLQGDETLSTVRFLLGDYSLMLGTSKGRVIQWFPVRGENNEFSLHEIRSFNVGDAPIHTIAIEKARKGFATTDASGAFNLFHSTAERHLNQTQVSDSSTGFVVISNRANGALVETGDGQLVHYLIDNQHPDVSVSSLWGKVWYEGYTEPDYVWQSSSASSDFEPKFSMMPLTFGTIKAALYSMLFAVPIAVLAAIFTAFFMDKKTRQWVKPSVELIEALPTVILGFLAGLWLAPYMEANLPGFFALLLVVPIGILAFGFAWSRLPEHIRLLVPVGKRAVLMIPVVFFLGWFALQLSAPIEDALFNGDMRHWLTFSAGIDFDQRNAMVIGFAMGFALIPTIFSVTEDAIYNVPSYLVNGSLALGASGWQTLVGVVLPTASPGIFSAIMLGFGRGVGETMIVLMASGNTPLMEVNLFEGLRTLSANLAVEMPEAAVDSSHYRVLFLSGLVLFIFTFIFNTLAEVVRQRMRRKYGSL
ncbi:ABC transporter permease subunit [Thiomicrorhabdus sp. zzn3]|uniref:ABC transporter permease subunit n=1 Tax=Thiomicrorhabdus sp. zzn3 TaxID=3039775 RepID=UPI002436CBAE|nr:ABC transporter permease subunit [Thiomicrorhabdus sp. zzn3]MDG6777460.1 ABC transporter permease subunit [Thiomicrorhabdus sp. zzn3]